MEQVQMKNIRGVRWEGKRQRAGALTVTMNEIDANYHKANKRFLPVADADRVLGKTKN